VEPPNRQTSADSLSLSLLVAEGTEFRLQRTRISAVFCRCSNKPSTSPLEDAVSCKNEIMPLVSRYQLPARNGHPLNSKTLRVYKHAPCSLGLSDTSQQYFSFRTNQPPAISQQYFSLRTNQHQPSATSQTNVLVILRRHPLAP
jgi:hypothetical protein